MAFGLENLLFFGKFSNFYCTSRLSILNGEICLQKYLPISCKLSITNYLKQNAIDYQIRLTTGTNLKVEEKVAVYKKVIIY